MKKIVMLCFLFPLCLVAQNRDSLIQDIRSEYNRIINNKEKYENFSIDLLKEEEPDEEIDDEESDDAIHKEIVTFYVDNNEIQLITVHETFEHIYSYEVTTEYYIKNNSLFFIYQQHINIEWDGYSERDEQLISIEEQRIYYQGGNCIRYLNKQINRKNRDVKNVLEVLKNTRNTEKDCFSVNLLYGNDLENLFNIFNNKYKNHNIIGYSQQTIPETLIYKDSIPYFYAWNDSVIQTHLNRLKRETYISINRRITDTVKTYYGSLGQNISSNDRMRKDIIYDNGIDIYSVSLETGKMDTILRKSECGEFEGYNVVIKNQLIGSIDFVDTLYSCCIVSYDIDRKQKKILYKMNNDDNDYTIWGIDATITGLLLIHFGDAEALIMTYYTYDMENNLLTKKDYSTYIKNLEEDDINFSHDDISGKYMIMGRFWMDTIFDIVQPTLRRNSIIRDFRGFKIKETDSYYYLKSEIDEPLRKNGSGIVWLACRFTLPFDFCLYKIYKNELLTKDEITKFDEWELHKLKNMVFAKHDYKFESLYLQAFYNLFAFYDGKYKDVNHLLTPEDKKNLELIQEVSKK